MHPRVDWTPVDRAHRRCGRWGGLVGMVNDCSVPLRLTLPFRCHMRLAGRSPLTLLLRHGSFVAPPEGFLARLHEEINEIAGRDIEALPREILEIEVDGVVRQVGIDMRNTQFIGADRIAGAFPDGYEPDVLALIDAFVGPDDTFIDVGANWGYMSLHCLLRPDFKGRVIAIEPSAGPRADFKHIIAACGFEDRVTVLPYAIGAAHGTAKLSRPLWSGMTSTVDVREGDEVALRCLDELTLPAFSLIKVDIEGSEAALLQGGRRTILEHRPAIVFESRMDTPGGDWVGPYTALDGLGYTCFAAEAAVTPQATGMRYVQLTLTPINAGIREAFPAHLNILAVPDRNMVEASRHRTQTTMAVPSAVVTARSDLTMRMPHNCRIVMDMLDTIELPTLDASIDTTGFEVDLQGWGDQDPIFDYVMQHWSPQLILEVGSWKGASAIRMADLLRERGIAGLILCVDTWLGSNASLWQNAEARASLRLRNGYPSMFLQFAKNVVHTDHADRIRYLPMTSTSGAQLLAEAGVQADAIYVDAGHNEDEVYTDIRCYYPLLKPGGILFGDDYSASWPGTVKAVNRFVSETGLKLTGTEWKWLVRKPEAAMPIPAATTAAAPVPARAPSTPIDETLVQAHQGQQRALQAALQELQQRDVALARASAESERSADEVRSRDAAIEDLRAELERVGQQVAAIPGLRTELERVGQDLAAARVLASELGQQLAGMRASTSWRITRPFRAASTMLRGRRGPASHR